MAVQQPPNRGKYVALNDNSTELAEPIGFFTPEYYVFDELFFKKVIRRAAYCGYTKQNKLHIVTFRYFLERLFDLLGETPNIKIEEFGAKNKSPYLGWEDLRTVFEGYPNDPHGDHERLPRVKLSSAERFKFLFEGNTGQGESVLSRVIQAIIFAAILANMIVIFGLLGETVGNVCAIIFSIEYICKLVVAPVCRHSFFDEDWVLEQVVVDPTQSELLPPSSLTPLERVQNFVLAPMSLVDLLSILPTWLEPVLPHGVDLKALRLFRLLRVLKLSRFSPTLTVLMVTIANSLQAIGVLCLYIAMISLIAGAVMQQCEYPVDPDLDEKMASSLNKSFADVPTAMTWVAGRMVTIQHSTPQKGALPQSLISAGLVIFLGLFKGIIFVLPIASITEAYAKADKRYKDDVKLQHEVTKDKNAPLGTEWCKDPDTPAARIELYSEDGQQCGKGSFNLPFYVRTQKCEVTFLVPLIGSLKGIWSAQPGVEVKVDWQPDPESKPEMRLPKGKLIVKLIKASNFKPSAGGSWRCFVEIPVKLHPENSRDHLLRKEFKQLVPGGDASAPVFDHEEEFTVHWQESGGKKKTKQELQREVLEMLVEQGKKLLALQSKVEK